MAFWRNANISFVGGWWNLPSSAGSQDVASDKWLDGVPKPDGVTPSLQLSLTEFPRIIPGDFSKTVRKKRKKNSRYVTGHSRPLMTLPTDEILKKHVQHISSLFRPPRQQTKVVPAKLSNPPWNDRHNVSDSKDNPAQHDHFRRYFTKPSDPAGGREDTNLTVVDTFLSTAPHTLFDCSVRDTYPEASFNQSSVVFQSQDDDLLEMLDSSLAGTIRPEPSSQSTTANKDTMVLESGEIPGEEAEGPREQNNKADTLVLSRSARRESKQYESKMLRELLDKNVDESEGREDLLLNLANDCVEQFVVFYEWAKKEFGSLCRLWNKIDANNSMSVTRSEFFKALVHLGYQASELKDLWAIFDRDHTDTVSFNHFDPETALHLSAFKQWAHQEFGSIHDLCSAWDDNGNGKLTLKEFTDGCEKHGLTATHAIRCLFQMCGSTKTISEQSELHLDDISFLDTWQFGEHMNAAPDRAGQQLFKRQLLRLHKGNALSAWRKEIDKDGSMRVNYHEFVMACKKVQKQCNPGDELNIGGVWRAFDSNYSGWLSLKEFDQGSHEQLGSFKKWVVSKYGTTLKFIQQLGVKEIHPVNMSEMYVLSWKKFYDTMKKQHVFDNVGYRRTGSMDDMLEGASDTVGSLVRDEYQSSSMQQFFDALDVDRSGFLTPANLRFLDHWDMEKEQAEETAWASLAQTRQELKTQFVRETFTGRRSSMEKTNRKNGTLRAN
eukprot:gnl/MRDRNA2_/MRDRNA2_95144_c0_seq1.p1 gnl/MRDRNA2_/MRDRNA2_95144_c0~~gnl/MRDRNA2_/MRDRNA2_95144_c0_seq1.p1  ORF type:complete len:720 (+),score=126.66 gnl/MRDRNA2_/MRDRNA2_95144_c0_seq1:136-2295(+)